MASILDMVQQQLSGGAINQISSQIGADPGTTQSAVQMALPMLLGGLAQNATQPGGAEALHTALDDHTTTLDSLSGLLGGGGAAASGNALGGLGGMFGGAGTSAGVGGASGGFGGLGDLLGGAIGGKILGHILGGRRGNVEQTVSQNSGLDTQQVGQLLMMLAPIVMGVLARKKQQDGLNPGQLGSVLQQNHQQVQQGGGMLGGLLGQVFGR